MGFRFYKSVRIAKGVRLKISKRGVGISAGTRGFRVSAGPRGTRVTASVPGTGISYTTSITTSPGHRTTKHTLNDGRRDRVTALVAELQIWAEEQMAQGVCRQAICNGLLSADWAAISPEQAQACSESERWLSAVMVERNNQGIALEKERRISEAIQLYELNIADGVRGSHPYERLRIIYARQKDYENAIRVCDAFLVLPSQDTERQAWVAGYREKLTRKQGVFQPVNLASTAIRVPPPEGTPVLPPFLIQQVPNGSRDGLSGGTPGVPSLPSGGIPQTGRISTLPRAQSGGWGCTGCLSVAGVLIVLGIIGAALSSPNQRGHPNSSPYGSAPRPGISGSSDVGQRYVVDIEWVTTQNRDRDLPDPNGWNLPPKGTFRIHNTGPAIPVFSLWFQMPYKEGFPSRYNCSVENPVYNEYLGGGGTPTDLTVPNGEAWCFGPLAHDQVLTVTETLPKDRGPIRIAVKPYAGLTKTKDSTGDEWDTVDEHIDGCDLVWGGVLNPVQRL